MKLLTALIHDEWFRSAVNILIGFLIGQLTGFVAERRERKKAIAHALSDLLIVKYQLFALEEVVEEIGEIIGDIPEHEKSQLRVVFNSLLPNWNELHSRYDQSVTTLAGLDPLMAFDLRSKDFILPLLNWVHSVMAQDPQAAAMMGPVFKTKLMSKVEPLLDKSLLRLAREKNLLCWYETHRLLKKGVKLPDELQDFLEPVKKIVEAQLKVPPHAKAEGTG